MEEYFHTPNDCISNAIRKKRTQTSRRPKPDGHPSESQERLSVPSTPLLDDTGKLSHRKELNINQFISGFGDDPRQNGLHTKNRNIHSGRNGENHISDSLNNLDGSGNENKVKLKLKLGGVTHTLHGNSTSNGASGSSSKSNQSVDAKRPSKQLILQRSGLQGIPWKDFASRGIHLGRGDVVMGLMAKSDKSTKQVDKLESVRKSHRAPKRRKLDAGLDDEEDDDEIRYLEKLRTSKVSARYKDDEESGKNSKLSRVSNIGIAEGKFEENLGSFDSSRSSKDGKKSRSGKVSEDGVYEEVGESGSDSEGEGDENLNQRKESVNALMESKKELALTTRQRALQSGKDASSATGASLEFPNGLPPAPSKKQKEKLSDVDQQVKKAEAAQRRRMQNEKAARESEAEAIRKILGQDSSRKKREDQKKKRQEELAQEKAAEALKLASTTIRWNMGPTGTVVTFPAEMGLPSIFETRTRSYPPPHENCAGPSCSNPYKYRDSKSKLPLCSLKCYKAIQEKLQSDSAC